MLLFLINEINANGRFTYKNSRLGENNNFLTCSTSSNSDLKRLCSIYFIFHFPRWKNVLRKIWKSLSNSYSYKSIMKYLRHKIWNNHIDESLATIFHIFIRKYLLHKYILVLQKLWTDNGDSLKFRSAMKKGTFYLY